MKVRNVLLVLAGALVTALGVGAWTVLRVEDIPEELEPPGDPSSITIPGVGEQADLDVAALQGKTVFFVWVGIQSWGSDEGKKVNRALNRWILPEETVGRVVFNAEGLGFLREKAGVYMDAFGKETRYPIYGDFEGQFGRVFKLPQGHHALIVLGPDGNVALRKVGGIQDDGELQALRDLLGAQEPAPGPPVPEFALADTCAAKPCALLFLGDPVARTDIPGIDDGFEGEKEQEWAQMKKPAVRMAATALNWHLAPKAHGVIIGDVTDLEFEGWDVQASAPDLAEAFEVDTTTWIIIKDGRVAYREEGAVQFYKVALFADAVGVELEED